jgi:hypothetical protein
MTKTTYKEIFAGQEFFRKSSKKYTSAGVYVHEITGRVYGAPSFASEGKVPSAWKPCKGHNPHGHYKLVIKPVQIIEK